MEAEGISGEIRVEFAGVIQIATAKKVNFSIILLV
jgi:hypothetical protein